jgi:hypothetical protein
VISATSSRAGDDFDLAVWDGGEEILAIGFVDYARVKDNDYAGVGFASNQPTEALLELENRRRELIIIKRVATLLLNLLEPAGNQGLIRDGKRQPNNNHIAKSLAGDINALPETIGAKKSGAILRLKQLQKRSPVKLSTLLQQADTIFGE